MASVTLVTSVLALSAVAIAAVLSVSTSPSILFGGAEYAGDDITYGFARVPSASESNQQTRLPKRAHSGISQTHASQRDVAKHAGVAATALHSRAGGKPSAQLAKSKQTSEMRLETDSQQVTKVFPHFFTAHKKAHHLRRRPSIPTSSLHSSSGAARMQAEADDAESSDDAATSNTADDESDDNLSQMSSSELARLQKQAAEADKADDADAAKGDEQLDAQFLDDDDDE